MLALPYLLADFANEDGLIAIGGDLRPERLLQAYRNGVFPWYDENEPICWWSPNPRAIFELNGLHVSRRLRRVRRSRRFTVTVNRDFAGVIRGCAEGRAEGTWITPEMIVAYETLHRLGYAHSVEAWEGNSLVGGLYGVDAGGAFSGESMFCYRSNASKLALLYLIEHLQKRGLDWIDIQMLTPHMEALGAKSIDRSEFLQKLSLALKRKIVLFAATNSLLLA